MNKKEIHRDLVMIGAMTTSSIVHDQYVMEHKKDMVDSERSFYEGKIEASKVVTHRLQELINVVSDDLARGEPTQDKG